MDKRLPEIFTALTFLFISLYYVAGLLVNLFSVSRTVSLPINQVLSLAVFILAAITAALLFNDTRK